MSSGCLKDWAALSRALRRYYKRLVPFSPFSKRRVDKQALYGHTGAFCEFNCIRCSSLFTWLQSGLEGGIRGSSVSV